MRVCMIGTGYVGLVTGACLAEQGNHVWCVDIDEDKISRLNAGVVPIYEPGLEDIIKRNVSQGLLKFTTDTKEAVKNSFFVFIAVGTPPDGNGNADLKYVMQAAQNIGACMEGYKIIAIKSTVPVRTTHKIKTIITGELTKRGRTDIDFDVAFCPEFLKEGSAVDDFLSPDRIYWHEYNRKAAGKDPLFDLDTIFEGWSEIYMKAFSKSRLAIIHIPMDLDHETCKKKLLEILEYTTR